MYNDITVKKLYHYTSLPALTEILRSNQFNISLFENANDSKDKRRIVEYKYLSFCDDSNDDGFVTQQFGNSMMWYHYGEKYKGVCIEFLKNKLLENVSIIRHGRIVYRDGISHIDNQTILDYLMEKRTCWKGENEYRLLFDRDSEYINIEELISAVYVFEENMPKVRKILGDRISLYKVFFDSIDGRVNRMNIIDRR